MVFQFLMEKQQIQSNYISADEMFIAYETEKIKSINGGAIDATIFSNAKLRIQSDSVFPISAESAV